MKLNKLDKLEILNSRLNSTIEEKQRIIDLIKDPSKIVSDDGIVPESIKNDLNELLVIIHEKEDLLRDLINRV